MNQTRQLGRDELTPTYDDLPPEPDPTKRTARIVGVLFIIATVAAAAGVALLGSVLGEPDVLARVTANETRVIVAGLLDLVTAGCVVAIPVLLYPILKRHDERIALGYMASRLVEGIVIVFGAITLLSLMTVAQEAAAAGAAGFAATGAFLEGARDWTDLVGTQVVFGLTALILNYSFYRSRIVPRFISVWGLLGAALIVASSLTAVALGLDPFSTLAIALALPIAINEMVLAVWLIVKGFNRSALTDTGTTSVVRR